MIELRGLSKSYRVLGGTWKTVLDDVTLQITPTMNMGILGRNGSGKSTMLRLLSGIEMPDKGQVITHSSRLSWLLGTPAGIHGSLTGVENVCFICKIFGKEFDEVFPFVQEFAELDDYMNMPVKTYSSGMRSRLGFGISMAIDFDTYLIDEGFGAGDARFRAKTQALFEERRHRSNMIVVSHNPATVSRFCNVIAVLNNGRIRLYEDIDEGIRVYQDL